MHLNYFEEYEAAANDFRTQNRIPTSSGISQSWLESILRDEFQCSIVYDDFSDYPELTPLRSISPSTKKNLDKFKASTTTEEIYLSP